MCAILSELLRNDGEARINPGFFSKKKICTHLETLMRDYCLRAQDIMVTLSETSELSNTVN